MILETEFETDSGSVLLVDFMAPGSATTSLIRLVVGKRGRVPMKMELVIRFDYGSIVPWVRHTETGISAIAGPDMLSLRTKAPLRGENLKTHSEFFVSEGQTVPFDLVWYPSQQKEPPPENVYDELKKTEKWWQEWSGRCTYKGKWHDAVLRSLITLKALTFWPTGGIVAAPTTSLPELIGGIRNWDYRFCWVRDATLTLNAFLSAGYFDEAREWKEWLLRAVAGNPSELNILYGLRGERRFPEIELPWLPGYANSAPVRTGNAAYQQFQLDIYGEVANTLYQCRVAGIEPNREMGENVAQSLLRFLESAWLRPDEGIWEVRGPRRHFTHSKVMAWVAVDRAVQSMDRGWFTGDVAHWQALRDKIHNDVCRQGFDPELNSFVQYYGSKHLDASLLMIPLVGFLPAEDPRVLGTVKAIERQLMQDDFVARYIVDPKVDGLPHGEGQFLACSFWLADNYVLQGRQEEAEKLFERLLEVRNDVGLLAEEYDPVAKRLLGNFPQAFSHIGLINTAVNLTQAIRHVGPTAGTQPVTESPK